MLESLGFRKEAHFRKNVYFRKNRKGDPIWKDTFVYALLNDHMQNQIRIYYRGEPMRILCFGDSNTYGYDPRGFFADRYEARDRWVDL